MDFQQINYIKNTFRIETLDYDSYETISSVTSLYVYLKRYLAPGLYKSESGRSSNFGRSLLMANRF